MTAASLRTPRQPPQPSPQPYPVPSIGVPSGWPGNNRNSTFYNGVTYIGFCDGDGNVRVAAYRHSTGALTVSPIIVSGLGADCHCGPCVLIRSSDRKIIVAVAPHAASHMYVAVSTNSEDVTSWGAATDIIASIGSTLTCTYANLFQLSGESGKLYLFFRNGSPTTGQLYYSTSTDGGVTWTAAVELYANGTNGPYWAISSDDTSRIDFAVSDGNVGSNGIGSMYHFYYTGGSFYTSDGTLITAALPLAPANITEIYGGFSNGYVRAPFDVVTNGGNPVAVWSAWNHAGSGSNMNYWYASCSGGVWTVNLIHDTGSTSDPQFNEGGVCIDHTNPNRVYVSIDTSGVWQIYTYLTANAGATWTSTQMTSDSGTPGDAYNLRPVSPRNANSGLPVVWLFGPHYSTPPGSGIEPPAARLRGFPNPIKIF